ncbi:MAG: hypothetical protein QOJ54_1818 [Aliidongia sp.]|jgi:hypothetical protein|nr:hypothetical protein [Aliidongia sp.]
MSSFLTKLFGRKPAAPAIQPKPKSAARLADERNILDARRKILANMARIEQHPTGKQKIGQLIDEDRDRASQVVRRILMGEDAK